MSSKKSKNVDNDDKRHKAEPVVPLPFWLWVFKHVSSFKLSCFMALLIRIELTSCFTFQTQGILTTATTVGVIYYHNVHSIYFVGNILTTSFLGKVIERADPVGEA